MEKLEQQLANSLYRINFIFRNERINTECIKSHNGFNLLGESFGPFEKGKKYKLKIFSAIPFIKNEVLKVDESDKCDNVDVQRYAIREKDDPKLMRLDNNYLLTKIKEFKIFVENDIKLKKKPIIDFDRFNSYTASIVDSRLLKLLKLAKAELSLEDERRLTISEKLLYKYIYNLIKTWRNFFLSIE
ncbi:MAG: hypothetical protein ACFFAN_17035 [Promethearchaeota archaeon]